MELMIANVGIRQDDQGRYCLNDLHRAAGGEKKHGPSYWMENAQTTELIAELADTGNPVSVLKGGTIQGTYVCKELVYSYAMWISPSFNLKVIRAYDQMQKKVSNIYDRLDDPASMRQYLLTYVEKVLELQPKADALDRLTLADGSMCITNAAKSLQVRPKDLFAFLSARKWIYKRAGGKGWIAYQDRIQSGHLEHKIVTVEKSDGSEKMIENVLVTVSGMVKLAQIVDANRIKTAAA